MSVRIRREMEIFFQLVIFPFLASRHYNLKIRQINGPFQKCLHPVTTNIDTTRLNIGPRTLKGLFTDGKRFSHFSVHLRAHLIYLLV